MTVQVIVAGCAECHWGDEGEPLIDILFFESVEEAKADSDTKGWLTYGGRKTVDWQPHPQGGEHVVVGQGSVWILPEVVKEIET